MGGGTVFLVPRRPDGGHRDRLWSRCRSHWQESCPEIPIIEGPSPDGPFNRGAAINRAAAATGWDVAVIIDADVICPPEQIHAAVELARATGRLVFGFTLYLGLNAHSTRQYLEGSDRFSGIHFRRLTHESSVVVVTHELFDLVEGFDERFVGWGQDDVAFAQSCRVLRGEPLRVEGTVTHLHHPRSPERDRRRPEWKANQRLGHRYRMTKEPDQMRELIAERKQTFSHIWARNGWNGTETPAGPGSTMAATRDLREQLPRIVAELGVNTVLDAGCADALWMPELPGYIGVDIIPEAVERAGLRHPDRTFQLADICSDVLPACELILVRDALQHLSLLDGLTALQNFRRTGAKWLLASSHEGQTNTDITSGEWYASNLEAAPFWLGAPRWSIPDGNWDTGMRWPGKIFGLWEL